MTHLPYIVAAYALGAVIPGILGLTAVVRMRTAQRRLTAVDPRAKRSQ